MLVNLGSDTAERLKWVFHRNYVFLSEWAATSGQRNRHFVVNRLVKSQCNHGESLEFGGCWGN